MSEKLFEITPYQMGRLRELLQHMRNGKSGASDAFIEVLAQITQQEVKSNEKPSQTD